MIADQPVDTRIGQNLVVKAGAIDAAALFDDQQQVAACVGGLLIVFGKNLEAALQPIGLVKAVVAQGNRPRQGGRSKVTGTVRGTLRTTGDMLKAMR